jgi:hypothetical protein
MELGEPVFAAIGLWFAVLFVSNGEWSVAVRSSPQPGWRTWNQRACRIFADLRLGPLRLIQI